MTMSLFDHRDQERKLITLESYRQLGSARRILAEYVNDILDSFPEERRAIAAKTLKALVTPLGEKAVVGLDEMVNSLSLDSDTAKAVLVDLDKVRLVRKVKTEEGLYYELTHEYMVDEIAEWISPEEMRMRVVQDLLKQEVEKWKKFSIPMGLDELKVIFKEIENLSITEEEEELLAQSAIRHDYEAAYWLKRTSNRDYFSEMLLDALGKDIQNVQAIETLIQGGDETIIESALWEMSKLMLPFDFFLALSDESSEVLVNLILTKLQEGDLPAKVEAATCLRLINKAGKRQIAVLMGEIQDSGKDLCRLMELKARDGLEGSTALDNQIDTIRERIPRKEHQLKQFLASGYTLLLLAQNTICEDSSWIGSTEGQPGYDNHMQYLTGYVSEIEKELAAVEVINDTYNSEYILYQVYMESLHNQIATHLKNIERLKGKIDLFDVDVPVYLINEIENEREELAKAQRWLHDLEELNVDQSIQDYIETVLAERQEIGDSLLNHFIYSKLHSDDPQAALESLTDELMTHLETLGRWEERRAAKGARAPLETWAVIDQEQKIVAKLRAAIAQLEKEAEVTQPSISQDEIEIRSLKNRLETHQKNLYRLEEKAAMWGTIDAPIGLLNDIDHEKYEIYKVKAMLRELEDFERPAVPLEAPARSRFSAVKAGRAVKLLAKLIRVRKESAEPPYVLILGTGIGLASGANSFGKVIESVVDDYSVRDPSAMSWDNKVAEFYDILDGCDKSERYAIIKKHLEGQRPSDGYHALVQLAKEGYFDVIFSTNYDIFVEEAFADASLRSRDFTVLINGQDTEEGIIRALSYPQPRIKLVKLHGDLSARNFAFTPEEIFQFSEKIESVLTDYLSRDVMICGHGMRDDDINRCLRVEGGSLWYVNPSAPTASDFIWRALRVRKGTTIEGEDGEFDNFFCALHNELVGVPPQ